MSHVCLEGYLLHAAAGHVVPQSPDPRRADPFSSFGLCFFFLFEIHREKLLVEDEILLPVYVCVCYECASA